MWSSHINILAIWSTAYFPPNYGKLSKPELFQECYEEKAGPWHQYQSWPLACTHTSPTPTGPLAVSQSRLRRPSGDEGQCQWKFSTRATSREWGNEGIHARPHDGDGAKVNAAALPTSSSLCYGQWRRAGRWAQSASPSRVAGSSVCLCVVVWGSCKVTAVGTGDWKGCLSQPGVWVNPWHPKE